MKAYNRVPQRFSTVRWVVCVILPILVAGTLTTPVNAAGMFTHDEIVQIALNNFTGDPALKALLDEHTGVVNYGSVWPDWGYAVQLLGGGGSEYADYSEAAHTEEFITTLAARLVPLFRKENRTQDEDKALAFLFGVISHKAADDPWHFGADGINGTADDQSAFLNEAMAHDGKSHGDVELWMDIGIRVSAFGSENYFEYWYPEQAVLDTYHAMDPYTGWDLSVSAGELSNGMARQHEQYNYETSVAASWLIMRSFYYWSSHNIYSYPIGGMYDMGERTADSWIEYWDWLGSYAPGLTISLSPEQPDGSHGWYRQPVTITLSATDYMSRPISNIYYQPTGADYVYGYTHPFTVSEDGSYPLSIWAADPVGNHTDQQLSLSIDQIAPTAAPTRAPAANAAGWNNSNVTVTWNWTDSGSGIDPAGCTTASTSMGEGAITLTAECKDMAGHTGTASYKVNVDQTAPAAAPTPAPAANAAGWNNSNVTVTWSWTVGGSGIDPASCTRESTATREGHALGLSASCTDRAGNTGSADYSVNIDRTKPDVALVGGPANRASYYFGSVPAAPTCTASDGLSGLSGDCAVAGYASTVGVHTVTASAEDLAGNTNRVSATYTVLPWKIKGFFPPVRMDRVNTAQRGSTVPLKFTVFAGSIKLTDVSMLKLKATLTLCSGGTPVEINFATAGGSSLRYDDKSGQFILNWKIPNTPKACYRVTIQTADGTSISAKFQLKQ